MEQQHSMVQEGNTKGAMVYTGEEFAHSFYRFGFFDVVMKWKYADGHNGISTATRIVNEGEPLSFERACEWMYGLLKPMGQGIPGFQTVVDAYIVPKADFAFISSDARDAWLLEETMAMAQRRSRKGQHMEQLWRVNSAYRDTVAAVIAPTGPGNFTAWMEEQHRIATEYLRQQEVQP